MHRSTWTFGEQRTTRTLSGGVVSVGMRQSTQTRRALRLRGREMGADFLRS